MKARLNEDKMSYEDLILCNNFDKNELTYMLDEEMDNDKNAKNALRSVRKLETFINRFQNLTTNGMGLVLKTINQIDESSKKMLFKHFDGQNVNHLSY